MAVTDLSTHQTWTTWNTCTNTRTNINMSIDYGCTSLNVVWYTWNSDSTDDVSNLNNVTYANVIYDNNNIIWDQWLSEDDRKRQERASRHYEEPRRFAGGLTDREKRELRADKAEARARNLLLDLIGEDELKVYQETGRLFVKGNRYDYIVRKTGTIQRIEKDKLTDLCVHLASNHKCPKTDNVIALKLALESDEDEVLQLANNHGCCEKPDQIPRAACM